MSFHLISNVRKRTAVLACSILSMAVTPAASQSQTCGTAVAQLQQYVAQVNSLASSEYYQGIPIRCGGNQQCMYMWLQQLNGWYMNQSNLVNGWYQQISSACTSGASRPSSSRVSRRQTRDAAPELDEDEVASLDVDDEDKTVRIRIPSNPSGYRR